MLENNFLKKHHIYKIQIAIALFCSWPCFAEEYPKAQNSSLTTAEPYGPVGSLMYAKYRNFSSYPVMKRLRADLPEYASFTPKPKPECLDNRYYKILEYKDFPDWRHSVKYVHLIGVQDSQCEGWFRTVTTFDEKNIDIEVDPEHKICPAGWLAHYTRVSMVEKARIPDPGSLVCFAPKNTPIPNDFTCKRWSASNLNNPQSLRDSGTKSGFFECAGGST